MKRDPKPLDVTHSRIRAGEVVTGDRSAARRLMAEHDARHVLVFTRDGALITYTQPREDTP